MRILSAFAAITAVLSAGPASAAPPETFKIISEEFGYLVAVRDGTVRRNGTAMIATVMTASRTTNSYTVNTVEYDCTWMKMRVLAYNRYEPDGTLAQSYRNGEWMGASGRGLRAWLCAGEGAVTDRQAASAHALAQGYLKGQ